MANKAKKGKGKARTARKGSERKQGTKVKRQPADLDALRKPVLTAERGLTKAEAEAKQLIEKGQALLAQSRSTYRQAVAAYQEASQKLGVPCEFPGECSANVTPKVSIEIIERTEDGVTLVIRGTAETKD